MVTPEYARTMARYNRWMNRRLYELCAGIPDEERKRDRGAFFKSIHGTLNHLLVGDRIWMGRFRGAPYVPKSLAEEVHPDFAALREDRRRMDDDIVQWSATLTQEGLAAPLRYTSIVNPAPRENPMGFAVAHFFNHQTHHRGQLTTLMMQAGIDPGVTDLLWVPAEA